MLVEPTVEPTIELTTPNIVEPPVVADVVPDAPWPERETRIKYHGGWCVRQLPPEPPKEGQSV